MKKRKKFFALAGMALCSGALIVSSFVLENETEKEDKSFVAYGLDIADEDTQYLGYGYDVTSGKAISDQNALHLATPILDVEDPELIKYEKAFSASQTTYLSYSSTSVREMSLEYGATLGGGVTGNIAAVSVDIAAKYNTKTKFSKKVAEEYSYYSIYAKNRTVLLQVGSDVLSRHLNPIFLSDVKKVVDEQSAANLFDKYGTHLVTGYNLGGIFEMTNYYATSSSSYVRQNETSFSSQINVALGNYGAGVSFSFGETYGLLDNNAFAVNNYKCTTYGGYTFPGLTIDQAFSYYQTAFGAGYIYGLWTDSINEGKNLSIVSIPESSKMIPLYNLLPDNPQYDTARSNLLVSYIKRCGLSYSSFLEKYSDVNGTIRPKTISASSLGFDGYGINDYKPIPSATIKEYVTTYTPSSEYSDSFPVSKEDVVSFDYNQELYDGYEVEWKTISPSDIEVLDARNGVFRIKSTASFGPKEVQLTVDGVVLYRIELDIENGLYYGGTGTESNPYLIARPSDLYNLMKNYDDWSVDKHFKLINDLDLGVATDTNKVNENIKPIGRYVINDSNMVELVQFKGVFDGNYHTIKHLRIYSGSGNVDDKSKELYLGLFGYNVGTISNLTIAAYDSDSDEKDDYDLNRNFISNYADDYTIFNNRNGYTGAIGLVNYDSSTAPTAYNFGVDTNKVNSSIRYVGGIVGYNDGTVTNCSVKNMDIRYTSVDLDRTIKLDKSNIDVTAVGLICGYNEQYGVIRECHSYDSSVRAFKYTNTQWDELSVGGIIGYNSATTRVEACSADSIGIVGGIRAKGNSDNDDSHGLYLGGITGCSKLAVNDCLVKNINGSDPVRKSGANDRIPYAIRGFYKSEKNANAGEHIYASLISGTTRFNSSGDTFFRDIAINSYSFIVNENNTTYAGNFVSNKLIWMEHSSVNGYCGTATFEDCYYAYSGSTTVYPANKTATVTGITKTDYLNWKHLPGTITDSRLWERDSDGNPSLVKNVLSTKNISFDFSKVKKEFYVYEKDVGGTKTRVVEEFKSGDIVVYTNSTNGDSVQITNYTIDTTSFENKKATAEPGEVCDITVSANGATATYQVKFVEPYAIGLSAKENESMSAIDYYAGEILNPKEIDVRKLTQTGESFESLEYYDNLVAEFEYLENKTDYTAEELARKDVCENLLSNGEYYKIEGADTPLKKGFNNFLITYEEGATGQTVSTIYTVYAKTAVVDSLSILYSNKSGGVESLVDINSKDEPYKIAVGTKQINPVDLEGLVIDVDLKKVNNEYDAKVVTSSETPSFKIRFDREPLSRNKLVITYDDTNLSGLSREIDADEVEFINPEIKYGDNEVCVCYDGYMVSNSATFKIKGDYLGSTDTIMETYVDKVLSNFTYDGKEYSDDSDAFGSGKSLNDFFASETLDMSKFALVDATNTKLSERRQNIVDALEAKEKLSSLAGDTVYIRLAQLLDEVIDQYNKDVSGVNDKVIESVKITTSFYYQSIMTSGYFALSLIFALIFIIL